MKRIKNLNINETDRVYKMTSGRMIKVRVLKKDVLEDCASFIISCSHVDEKGKAIVILNEGEDESYILAPPFTVTIPFNTIENPLDTLEKIIAGHSFTKPDKETGLDKTTVIKGRLEIDDGIFKTMENLDILEKDWSES